MKHRRKCARVCQTCAMLFGEAVNNLPNVALTYISILVSREIDANNITLASNKFSLCFCVFSSFMAWPYTVKMGVSLLHQKAVRKWHQVSSWHFGYSSDTLVHFLCVTVTRGDMVTPCEIDTLFLQCNNMTFKFWGLSPPLQRWGLEPLAKPW